MAGRYTRWEVRLLPHPSVSFASGARAAVRIRGSKGELPICPFTGISFPQKGTAECWRDPSWRYALAVCAKDSPGPPPPTQACDARRQCTPETGRSLGWVTSLAQCPALAEPCSAAISRLRRGTSPWLRLGLRRALRRGGSNREFPGGGVTLEMGCPYRLNLLLLLGLPAGALTDYYFFRRPQPERVTPTEGEKIPAPKAPGEKLGVYTPKSRENQQNPCKM
eukprot:gene9452-biopygen4709